MTLFWPEWWRHLPSQGRCNRPARKSVYIDGGLGRGTLASRREPEAGHSYFTTGTWVGTLLLVDICASRRGPGSGHSCFTTGAWVGTLLLHDRGLGWDTLASRRGSGLGHPRFTTGACIRTLLLHDGSSVQANREHSMNKLTQEDAHCHYNNSQTGQRDLAKADALMHSE